MCHVSRGYSITSTQDEHSHTHLPRTLNRFSKDHDNIMAVMYPLGDDIPSNERWQYVQKRFLIAVSFCTLRCKHPLNPKQLVKTNKLLKITGDLSSVPAERTQTLNTATQLMTLR